MMSYSFLYEGFEIEVHEPLNSKKNKEKKEFVDKRLYRYIFETLRITADMTRPEFAKWLGIPLRTIQAWEKGERVMPDYVMRLISYKVMMEKEAGRIGTNKDKKQKISKLKEK